MAYRFYFIIRSAFALVDVQFAKNPIYLKFDSSILPVSDLVCYTHYDKNCHWMFLFYVDFFAEPIVLERPLFFPLNTRI